MHKALTEIDARLLSIEVFELGDGEVMDKVL